MKLKIPNATGHALNWLVAVAEGFGPDQYMRNIVIRRNVKGKASCLLVPINRVHEIWAPASTWSQGGPIIERECIQTWKDDCFSDWLASTFGDASMDRAGEEYISGPTPLIAAMRCYVVSKLGEEVEVPDGLL